MLIAFLRPRSAVLFLSHFAASTAISCTDEVFTFSSLVFTNVRNSWSYSSRWHRGSFQKESGNPPVDTCSSPYFHSRNSRHRGGSSFFCGSSNVGDKPHCFRAQRHLSISE